MCGFVAIFSKTGKGIEQSDVVRMNHEIYHRGPDDYGYEFSDWFGLGFRRLSILDISHNGHQPMLDESGRYVMVFNGELYNYLELKKELILLGQKFTSNSDSEVALKAYMQWGEDCVDRFLGMFSIIIVDKKARKAFFLRDQLGIKPFYYTETSEYLYIASEIKAFRPIMNFSPDPERVYEQFIYGYVAGENTPFRDVKKMNGGYKGVFDQEGVLKLKQYYHVTDSLRSSKTFNESGLLREIQHELEESIMLHTQSDVGFNVQLSGGLDSSFITSVVSSRLQSQIHTYGVKLSTEEDESQYQRYVSSKCHTAHHELELGDEDMAEAIGRATWHMDVPIVHFASVFLYLLCKESAKESKVILTGEGADELFGGYTRYKTNGRDSMAHFLQRVGVPPGFLPNVSPFKGLAKRMERAPWEYALHLNRTTMENFINVPTKNLDYRIKEVMAYKEHRKQLFAQDQTAYLESLLDRQDKMSMAASVEARVPYCNHRLFDKLNQISPGQKIKGNEPKYLLKKNCFSVPLSKRFRLPKKSWFCSTYP